MTKNELVKIQELIQKEYLNLNKSKNRPRSEQNILEKREILNKLINKYKLLLKSLESNLTTSDWNNEIETYNTLKQKYTESIKILDETTVLEPKRTKIKFKTLSKTIILFRRLTTLITKMPTVDIKLGTALVNTYDGCSEKLNAFIDAVALFNDTVDAEFAAATAAQKTAATETVFKFIKTRLTGNARQAITGAQNLNEVLTKIKNQCASKITSDNLKAKLGALKQKGSLDEFCDQVEQLTLRLTSTYIDEEIPMVKANQMATKSGIETLINGVNNHETKLILRAGTFTKISEATQKIQECNATEKNKSSSNMQAQVFMARGNHTQHSRGRGRFNGGRGRYSMYSTPFSERQGNNQSRFPSYYNNQQQFRYPNQRGQGFRRGGYGTPRYYNQANSQQRQQQALYVAQSNPLINGNMIQPQIQNSLNLPVNSNNQQQTNFLGQTGQQTPRCQSLQ